jgi:tryptophan synthase alpha subunit
LFYADGIVISTVLVNMIEENSERADSLSLISSYARDIKPARSWAAIKWNLVDL